MIDPGKKQHMTKLEGAHKWSNEQMKHYRRRREFLIRQQVGAHWGPDGTVNDVVLHYLRQAKGVYGRQLAARTPKVLVGTPYQRLKPLAALYQRFINRSLLEMDFKRTLAAAVDDALESVGVVKIMHERQTASSSQGWLYDPGMPFCERVSLDDYVCDMSVVERHHMRYESDSYWVALGDLREYPQFSKSKIGQVQPQSREGFSEDGDELAQSIGLSHMPAHDEDVEPMVQLRDIFLHRERKLVTVPTHQPELVLAADDWEGPEGGPYVWLGFGRVSDNIMPFSPMELLVALHLLANEIYRKLSEQAKNQKKFAIGPRGDTETGETIAQAEDGHYYGVNIASVNQIKEMSLGGADGGNFAFSADVHRRYDTQGGNLSLLQGTSPASPTATQDEMLMRQSSALLAEMMDATVDFVVECVKRLGWYWWYHPTLVMEDTMEIQGTGVNVTTRFSPEERAEADFQEHNFSVVPYSMRHVTPEQRLANIERYMTNIGLPALQLMQQDGATIDWQKLNQLYADFSDTEQLREIIVFTTPRAEPPGPVGKEAPRAAQTTRRYVRESRSAQTGQGADTAIAQMAAGKSPQPAEASRAFSL